MVRLLEGDGRMGFVPNFMDSRLRGNDGCRVRIDGK